MVFDQVVRRGKHAELGEFLEMILDEALISVEANHIVVQEINWISSIEEEVPNIESDLLG